ncbi:MAG: Gfo/Idh/MocA family oxidoreductase [Candidatus Aenigmarchaeota archaeon]|nr:Gfo/Idh/MocA family oxidoreductase [Candidatus Aenigmarchaeota archaeon]
MESPLRIGIIGCGDVVVNYSYPELEKYEPDRASLVWVAGVKKRDDRLNALSHLPASVNLAQRIKSDNVKYYTIEDFNDSRLDEIDAVYIASTNDTQRLYAEKALNRQNPKHVICEKPLVSVLSDIEGMAFLDETHPEVVCMETAHYLYKGACIELGKRLPQYLKSTGRRIISVEGYIREGKERDIIGYSADGKPVYMNRLRDTILRKDAGGGLLRDTGTYLISLVYATGAEINEVRDVRFYNYDESAFDTETACEMDFRISGNGFDDNCITHIEVAKFLDEKTKLFRITFDKGEGDITVNFDENKIVYRSNGHEHSVYEGKEKAYYNMLGHFLECVKQDLEPATPFSSSVKKNKIIEDICKTAKWGDMHEFYD